jgi:hypothetical protein
MAQRRKAMIVWIRRNSDQGRCLKTSWAVLIWYCYDEDYVSVDDETRQKVQTWERSKELRPSVKLFHKGGEINLMCCWGLSQVEDEIWSLVESYHDLEGNTNMTDGKLLTPTFFVPIMIWTHSEFRPKNWNRWWKVKEIYRIQKRFVAGFKKSVKDSVAGCGRSGWNIFPQIDLGEKPKKTS